MVNLAASTISEPSKWLNLDEKLAGKTKQNLSMVQLANCTADFSRCFFLSHFKATYCQCFVIL